MSGWAEVCLDDLVDIGSSKRIFYKEYQPSGVPFYRSKEIIEKSQKLPVSSELNISQERYDEIEKKHGVPKKGDLLLTSVGTLGTPWVVDQDQAFYFKDGNLTWFKNFSERLHNQFLYYWLLSPQGKESLDMVSIGSTQPALTIKGLKTLRIACPSFKEQKTIASVLSNLDDKIDLLHHQNKTLEAMAETLFRQWFVEVEGDGCAITELVEFNPLRKLPKGTLAPYLEMAALSTDTFNPSGWYDREFSSGSKFINGDTLLARITPCLENGKTAYVSFLCGEQVGWGSTEFIVMRPTDGLHPLFAYVLARNSDFRDYAEGCMAGSSGRQRVDIAHLKQYEIVRPGEELIAEFNGHMESITPKLQANMEQINTLEKLRDTLLPKLISGEVRVA